MCRLVALCHLNLGREGETLEVWCSCKFDSRVALFRLEDWSGVRMIALLTDGRQIVPCSSERPAVSTLSLFKNPFRSNNGVCMRAQCSWVRGVHAVVALLSSHLLCLRMCCVGRELCGNGLAASYLINLCCDVHPICFGTAMR